MSVLPDCKDPKFISDTFNEIQKRKLRRYEFDNSERYQKLLKEFRRTRSIKTAVSIADFDLAYDDKVKEIAKDNGEKRMKRVLLKNKKTGIIGELNITNRIVVYEPDMPLCGNSILGEYDTLNELNEEWEDYNLAEPLIKDEKIRNAVRAWAEACEISSALVYHSFFDTFLTLKSGIKIISFQVETPKELEFGKTYTISELCGEDENE